MPCGTAQEHRIDQEEQPASSTIVAEGYQNTEIHEIDTCRHGDNAHGVGQGMIGVHPAVCTEERRDGRHQHQHQPCFGLYA